MSEVFAARRAIRAAGLLRAFNEAGVLAPADVHVARRLAELAGEEDDAVRLATALAVRGPRLGHVYVDVATIHATATVDAEEPVDLAGLPWPEPAGWLDRLRASPLVDGPLRLEGSALYLDRLWREERQIAADLRALRDAAPAGRARRGAAGRTGSPGCSTTRARRRRPRPPCGGASRSSPAGPAPARRRPSRGSSRCCSSRAARRSSRSRRRPARRRRGSPRRSTTRPRRSPSTPRSATA